MKNKTEILKKLADNTISTIHMRLQQSPERRNYEYLCDQRKIAYLKIYRFFRAWVESAEHQYLALTWEESQLIQNRYIKIIIKLIGLLMEGRCRKKDFGFLGHTYLKIKHNK